MAKPEMQQKFENGEQNNEIKSIPRKIDRQESLSNSQLLHHTLLSEEVRKW